MTKQKSPFFDYINQWVAYTRRGRKITVIASDSTIEGLSKTIKNSKIKNLSVINIPDPDFKYSY
jgi:hypothetical protein